MKPRILIIGAAVIDTVIEVERLPQTGEDIYGKLVDTVVGGCGYNVQRVVAQFDQEVDFLCPIGTGQYADVILKEFKQKQIPPLVRDLRMDNGWNISFVEAGGERTFLSLPGVEVHWVSDWFKSFRLDDYRLIYVSGYELEGTSGEVIVSELEHIQDAAWTKIVFDPGPRAAYLDEETLSRLFALQPVVHCNKEELFTLTNVSDVTEGVTALFERTKTTVIVTLGADGCVYYSGAEIVNTPSEKVAVVDTIGAGDSHTGAFIAGQALGLSTAESCLLANKVSAAVVATATGNFEGIEADKLVAEVRQTKA